ncbi:Heterochromatin protein 1 [Aphelenchoides fujianensis]|nr:Heterochromatin protein 1 [Aphelenchoides fujianensis]
MPTKRKKTKKKAEPESEEEDDEEEEREYWVEAILDKRQKEGTSENTGPIQYEYLVKWRDYPETENTWEPEDVVADLELLDVFEAQRQQNELVPRPAPIVIPTGAADDPNIEPEAASDRGDTASLDSNQPEEAVEPEVETRAVKVFRELLKRPQVLLYDQKQLWPEFNRLPLHIWKTSASCKVLVLITDSPEVDEHMPPDSFLCNKQLHEGWAIIYSKEEGRLLAGWLQYEMEQHFHLRELIEEVATFGAETALMLVDQQHYEQLANLASETCVIA